MAQLYTSPYRGSAQITREQFLFYEMRTTAELLDSGLEDKEIIERIVKENLFQYPTEKTIAQMAKTCIKRLKTLQDKGLIRAIVTQPAGTAKQISII